MTKIKLVKTLTDKGFPTHSKFYKSSHEYADKIEKKKFPKGYKKLKKLERKLKPNELMGKNTKSGKIEVERKFSAFKNEIGNYHEVPEHIRIKNDERKALRNKRRK